LICAANDLTERANAIPKASAHQQEEDKKSQADPCEKFLNPVETFFVVFCFSVDRAVGPMSVVVEQVQ
jgi:hypothetical protein